MGIHFIDMGTIDVAHRCGQSLSNLAQITQLVSIRATLQCHWLELQRIEEMSHKKSQ